MLFYKISYQNNSGNLAYVFDDKFVPILDICFINILLSLYVFRYSMQKVMVTVFKGKKYACCVVSNRGM